MAKIAGFDMPVTALLRVTVGHSIEQLFAVKRFDRDANVRHHVITMAGLYYANFRTPCLDYQDILGATSILTKDVRQVERAFSLMTFNVLAHNKDDHAKNFAFIRGRSGGELSPAYDLTFSHGMGGEHTTSVAGSDNPGPEKLMEIASAFRVNGAAQVIEDVRHVVSQWAVLAKANGVSTDTIREIGSTLQNISKRF